MKSYTKCFKSLCLCLFITLKLYGNPLTAPIYYVKASGGSGDGLTDETAWSYSKLNATNLLPGSTVLFRKGDVFYGKLNVQSGTADNLVAYGAYGTGPNPVITGLTAPASWLPHSGNIYYTTLDVPELNVVTLDGKLQAMGRYPKTGYLTYTSHSGNQSITGATALPFNPTGAEVVIRKIRQVTDRHLVTTYSGNTMGLSAPGAYNTVHLNNGAYQPQDGNGYFIQSSLQTLTSLGDWYFDKANRRLYMHFGSGTPAGHDIKLSTVPVLLQLNNLTYTTFQDLDLEGANRELVNSNNCTAITFTTCNFRKSYGGFSADNGMTNLLVKGGSITDLTNSALFVPQRGNNITVDGVSIRNIGTIPGAGGSGDGTQLGIWIQGNKSTVANCSLNNIGYHGIVLYGDNTLIEKNLINTYGVVKDDCGGIYEFQFPGVKHANKVIRNNIILNGVGVAAGAPSYEQYGQAAAIYLDANVNDVKVYDNSLAHGTWGGILLVGVGTGNEFSRNLTYNFSAGLLIHNFKDQPIRGVTMTSNTFVAKTAQQLTLYLQMYADDKPALYGTFNKNVYARPVDDRHTMLINREYAGGGGKTTISLTEWQTVHAQDLNSIQSLVNTSQDSNLRFEYNFTNQDLLVSLDNLYSDVTSIVKTTSIKLKAYSSSVLVKSSTKTPPAGVDSPCSSSTTDSGESHCNSSGPCNTFEGVQSGCNITDGYYNAFFGLNAGHNTTTGVGNTFMGAYAGHQSTTGFSNVALGIQAGYQNQTGSGNVMVGDSAGFNNTASYNLFLGSKAGYTNRAGQKETFVGYQAGYNAVADSNTFVGYRSGYTTTTGRGNLFFGLSAGRGNTTGSYNTFVGNGTGNGGGGGDNNVYIGFNTTGAGSDNTFIGTQAGSSGPGELVNATAIGAGARVAVNDALILGNNANVGIGTSAPESRLEVVSATANTSGLRLSKLTAHSPSTHAANQFLTVNGQGDVVKARLQLQIDSVSEWSDHVFSQTYPLRPLREVDEYIQQNGHLPGIPSATQVVQTGIDLTRFNNLLLAKIEELTLYIIRQEKAQEQQRAETAKQQRELDEFRKFVRRSTN